MMLKDIARFAAYAVAGSLMLCLGTTIGITAIATPETIPDHQSEYDEIVKAYEINQDGFTLGIYGQTLEDDPYATPDLMLVIGNSGNIGYAFFDEVFGDQLRPGKEMKKLSSEPFDVPVYGKDAQTVIDQFTVNDKAGSINY